MHRSKVLWLLFVAAAGCKTTAPASNVKTNARPASEDNRVDYDADLRAKTNPSHFEGPFTVAGPYVLNTTSTDERYHSPANRYGMFRLRGPDGKWGVDHRGHMKYLRELHYPLGDGSVGIRPFVVVEPPAVDRPGPEEPYTNRDLFNKDVRGNEDNLTKAKIAVATVDGNIVTPTEETYEATRLNELDDYLMKMTPDQPLTSPWEIYAVTTYMHPDEPESTFQELGSLSLKLQGAFSHMGNYYGRGRTRNSPFGYEQWKIWNAEAGSFQTRYPVNIYQVRLKGTDRRLTNVNARQMNTILNGDGSNGEDGSAGPPTVDFPSGGYEFDWLSLDSVANNLNFFAAWIDDSYPVTTTYQGAEIKWTDLIRRPEFATYCAEHVTASLNIALNLPFNERAFVAAYRSVAVAPAADASQPRSGDYGSKLFKLAQQRYKTLTGSDAVDVDFVPLYQRDYGPEADPLAKPELKQPNNSLVWPLQSTVDFIANYIEQYVSFIDIGAVPSAAVLLSLQKETQNRISIAPEEFLSDYALPVIVEMIAAESRMKVSASLPLTNYLQAVYSGFTALGVDASLIATIKALTEAKLTPQREALEGQRTPMSQEKAWDEFRTTIQPIVDKARNRPLNCAAGMKCVKWYSSPAIMHRLAIGIHKPHKEVLIEIVGTLFDPVDLYRVKGGTKDSRLVYEMNDPPN